MEYLLVLQQMRRKSETTGSYSAFISSTEKDLKASQASLKRQFTLDTAEFRGQVAALSEEMNAYMRVLLQYVRCMRADLVLFRDKLEVDAENTEKVKWITTQGFADSAREWNMQRVSIQ
jgi:hypothetical protein